MPEELLAGLNDAQREAVTHPGGPLLALTFSNKAAEEMRARAEELLQAPYEELHCSTFHAFCARLLHEESLAGGFDPFFHPVTPADRLALLMDHADDLEIRHHDLRGNPAPFFARAIDRIDRLKDEMVTADEYLRWATSLAASPSDADRDHAMRELEFA